MKGLISSFVFVPILAVITANPVIFKESSPSGEAVVAISSSDPDFNKYIKFAFPSEGSSQESVITGDNPGVLGRSFSFVTPGGAVAGDGRSFVSTSSFNPYLLPFFFNPINYEGIGLNNAGLLNNWFRGAEGFYDPSFTGNTEGEVKTVSAVNDNGHIYGNVKTITFDNRAKSVKS
ncbi:uncharacterized protein LOC135075020 [Ostrinia nubilalis]|uniref:uncharacterized protein LOC135075020 n=1 Tax=Ostrinia nubilalis TaxID=29057 RepID=UPI0030825111